MKKRSKIVTILLCVCLLFCTVSCDFSARTEKETKETDGLIVTTGPNETETRAETSTEKETVRDAVTYKILENKENFKITGRSTESSGGVTVDWTASGISFYADCEGTVTVNLFSSSATFFTAYVDGVRSENRLLAMSGNSKLKIAEGLSSGTHLFEIYKQTENTNSNCIVKSVTVCGELLARPADKEIYLEFYGDSITSGYGNLTTGSSEVTDPGSASWQDGTATYAYRIAEALNADWSMVSVSGIPFSKGFTTYTMGDIMEKINFKRSDTAYSFERKPTLVVVNLGTNDAMKAEDMSDVQTKVETMIATLRAKYGETQKILFLTGMMNDSCRTEILSAIRTAGGTGLYEYNCTESNRKGGNGHPDMQAHTDVAEEVVAYIQRNVF